MDFVADEDDGQHMEDQEQKQVNILRIMVSKNKLVPGPADSISTFSWVNV